MEKDRNTYGNILKSIGLFGGVKVFEILVGLIKNKFVAMLLGPEGMGICGMITNATSMVSSFTGLGLMSGSVRDVALASESKDEVRIAETTSVLRKLVLFTGCTGTIITILLARQLSLWSFGHEDYTNAFRIVSVILLFNQLCIGRTVLMQGTFHYRLMAKSSLAGNIIGLIVCVPLYYLFGYDGIVPVIVFTSLVNFLLAYFYSRRITLRKVKLTIRQVLEKGKSMIQLGLSFAIVGTLTTGQIFILRLFIANEGSLVDVGLYTAGVAISNQYVDMILSSMGTDYGPRLAALSTDIAKFVEAMNRQTKLIVTIITPMLFLFIVLIREIVLLLYSDKFVPITEMLEWLMFGMFFRAIAWCLSYTIAARGEAKKYMVNETVSLFYFLLFNIIGYEYGRFSGLGCAFIAGYACYAIHMYVICNKLHGFTYNKDVIKVMSIFFVLLSSLMVGLFLFKDGFMRYVIGIIGFILTTSVSLYYMNQMIPITQMIKYIKNNAKMYV